MIIIIFLAILRSYMFNRDVVNVLKIVSTLVDPLA